MPMKRWRLQAHGLMALLTALVATRATAAQPAQEAALLREHHTKLEAQLANNDFQRPIHIESSQQGGATSGAVFARISHDFGTVQDGLKNPAGWCDILIVVINIKQCVASTAASGPVLDVHVGKKSGQALEDAFHLQFQYRVLAADPDYLQLELYAAQGPLGTRNYRIGVAAVALDSQRSFMRISYAYEQGLAARMATRGYLATAGSGKVGFSVVSREADGRPVLVKQVRGIVERNAMRYYLAVETFLDTQRVPEPQRTEQRLQDWFSSTEQYARQLREVTRDDYMRLKRSEISRQQAAQRAS